jgi:membrane-associated phospholipid phosphatase
MEWASYLIQGPQVLGGLIGLATVALAVGGSLIAWRYLGRLEAVLVLAAALTSLVDSALKLAISSARPTADLVQVFEAHKSGTGFPSGHALFAAVFLGFIAYLTAIHVQQRRLRILILPTLLALILLIGASRVYLGAHWPSDVLGGYLIGGIFLSAIIWIYRTLKPRYSPKIARRSKVRPSKDATNIKAVN